MSRMITVWNPEHPANRMRKYRDDVFKRARALPNDQLDAMLAAEDPDVPLEQMTRAQKLNHIKGCAIREWIIAR